MEVLKLISEIENSINRFSRLDPAGKGTNNLEDRTMEIIQNEVQREKKKMQNIERDIGDPVEKNLI